MKNMEHLFLNKELSLLSQEKGWKGERIFYHHSLDGVLGGKIVPAPLYQQIVDWLRMEKDLFINIHIEGVLPKWYDWNIESIKNIGNNSIYIASGEDESYEDYYEALTVAIQEAFKVI